MRIFNRPQPGFKALLLSRFLALTVLSALAMFFFGARTIGMQVREDAAEHFREAALRVCEGVEGYLDLHRHAIASLTHDLQPAPGRPFSVADATRSLERTRRVYPGFRSLLVTDADGNILAATLRDASAPLPAAEIRRSVADRDYFLEPRRTGKPFLSGIFQGRGLGQDPIVALSAPITDAAGRFLGVIEGSIDITRLPLRADTLNSRPMVVAQDAAGRVIYSSRPELHRPLDLWEPYPLDSAAANSPFLLADPKQRYANGAPIPLFSVRFPIEDANWQVVAALPIDEINADAYLFYRRALTILALVILFAWALARLLARNIARPIVALAGEMQQYALDAPAVLPSQPQHPAREIAQIQDEFHSMGARLRETYRQLRGALGERDKTNAQLQDLLRELDRKVVSRTSELADSEARYRQVVEHSRDIIFRTDAFGRITFHNAAFSQIIGGKPKESYVGRCHLDLMDRACRDQVRTLTRRQITDRTSSIYLEYSITGADGVTRWIGQSTQLLLGSSRFPLGFQGIARDVTDKKMAELALREAEERYSLAVRGSNNGIWDWDLRTGFVYFAPRWKQMFGIPATQECHAIDDWYSRIHPEDAPGLRSTLDSYVQEGYDLFETELRMRHVDGTWRWILVCGAAVRGANGRALRIAGSKTDITNGKLADPLTGLPNRLSLLDVLESWMDRLREDPSRQFAVLFLDLDRFKLVNDSLGHVKGDHLLLGVSLRLSGALQSISNADGLVARLGGDEFVVLLDITTNQDAPACLADLILRGMEPPFHLDGSLVFVSTSIGIARSGPTPSSPESLLRDADTAMYHAKSAGRGRYAIFDSSMHARAVARLGLETDLRRAVDENEFTLFYQPQADLRTGRLVGFETLIRWIHPTRGLLDPGEFISVAEENGLILPIGRWVLEEGARQLAAWDAAHPACRQLSVSINLSARQFTDPTLASEVARILKETGLNPQRLHLEVTESMLADDPKVATEILKQLSTMGIALEVDDFGTGYSCLGQLNRLPFDTLKIDRSFVQALDLERDGHKMIDSIVSLANSLGIHVIAEGIETAAHWTYIAHLGCQFGQGYYFSRPVDAPTALAIALLRDQTPWPIPAASTDSLTGLLSLTENTTPRNTPV